MKIAKGEVDAKKMRRYIIMLALHPVLFLLRFTTYCMPRSKQVWAFGHPAKFEGNSKYLFLHIQNLKQDTIQTAWITRNKKLAAELRQYGYRAYYYFSLQGFLYCLRAKYYIVDTSVEVISYWLSGGAKLINLFHALPIKKMERDVTKGDSTEVTLFHSKGIVKLAMRFLFPWRFVKPWYAASTSPLYTKVFMSMFQIARTHIMETGFPRNDVLVRAIPGSTIGTDLVSLSEMEKTKNENPAVRLCVYAPTFRDTGDRSFLEDIGLLKKLDECMNKWNAVFWVKAHPFAKVAVPEVPFSHIRFANPNSDSYPLLKHADILITDYSSIFVDFLLAGRPEIFFPYDLEKYVTKDRELYFDYNEFTPGPKARTFEEFLNVLAQALQGKDEYASLRLAQRLRCLGNSNGNDSARTFDFLKIF